MPTPSHDDDAPSASTHSFSSCPEDLPQVPPSQPSEATADENDIELSRLYRTNMLSEPDVEGSSTGRDRQSSAQPSTLSRSTTASPRPRSIPADDTTDMTSPDVAGPDFDMDKEQRHDQESGPDGPLSREASVILQDYNGERLSGGSSRSLEFTDNATGGAEYSTPCFGPHFSSTRVSVRIRDDEHLILIKPDHSCITIILLASWKPLSWDTAI